MRGEFVEVDGCRLYYYAAGTRGRGEPIVLIHGFPTSSRIWSQVTSLLPEGHRLIVVDLLGYGRSDPLGKGDPSIAAHARRTLALLEVLNAGPSTVVGHGRGASIALEMHLHAPHRVSRLCLVNPIAPSEPLGPALRLAGWLKEHSVNSPTNLVLRAIRARLRKGFVSAERESHSIEQYLRPFSGSAGSRALLSQMTAFISARHDSAQLSTIAVPVAVVSGAEDPYDTSGFALLLKDSIPNATLEVISGARHFAPEEDSQVVARVISDLLSR